jgi:signal transduction histidine kinase
LLTNAIKFTPKGGRVQVQTLCLSSHIEIIVSDTGQGIPAEMLPVVFDRFRQLESRPTGTEGGLGLGLALVRHLVEAHGGTVTAQSPGEGKGSTFIVRLPRHVPNGADVAIADIEMSGPGSPAPPTVRPPP